MALWRSWLARRPVTAEVAGSSPVRVAIGTPRSIVVYDELRGVSRFLLFDDLRLGKKMAEDRLTPCGRLKGWFLYRGRVLGLGRMTAVQRQWLETFEKFY